MIMKNNKKVVYVLIITTLVLRTTIIISFDLGEDVYNNFKLHLKMSLIYYSIRLPKGQRIFI